MFSGCALFFPMAAKPATRRRRAGPLTGCGTAARFDPGRGFIRFAGFGSSERRLERQALSGLEIRRDVADAWRRQPTL
jgi:hypothetical protein